MKIRRVFAYFLVAAFLWAVFAPEVSAEMQVDRVWEKYGTGYALVSYQNTSGRTFKTVTIQCIALDPSGNKLNANTRSFFDFRYGPIRPGFEGTVKVPVSLHGGEFASMSCRIINRRPMP